MAKAGSAKPPKGRKGDSSKDAKSNGQTKLAFTDEETAQLRGLCSLSDAVIRDIEKFLFVDFALRSRLPQRSPARKEKDELEALIRSIKDTVGRLEHLDPFISYQLDYAAHHSRDRAIQGLTSILEGVERKQFLPEREEGNQKTKLKWIVMPVATILKRHDVAIKPFATDFRTVLEVCLSSIGYDEISIEALVRRDKDWLRFDDLDDESNQEADDEHDKARN